MNTTIQDLTFKGKTMNANCFVFSGRKPSYAQCLSKAKTMAKQGYDYLSIQWGENWVDLQKQANGYWCGFGFLKDIDAYAIARDLNHS